MYKVPVFRVQLVRDGNRAVPGREVSGPPEAARIVREYLRGEDREHFVVLLLDARQRVKGINTVSIGTLTASLVHPRETFKPAILAGAAGIIVAHNHPSGDPIPSPEDREVMRRLLKAGELLGIPVYDFLVVTDGEAYYSAKERGTLVC